MTYCWKCCMAPTILTHNYWIITMGCRDDGIKPYCGVGYDYVSVTLLWVDSEVWFHLIYWWFIVHNIVWEMGICHSVFLINNKHLRPLHHQSLNYWKKCANLLWLNFPMGCIFLSNILCKLKTLPSNHFKRFMTCLFNF